MNTQKQDFMYTSLTCSMVGLSVNRWLTAGDPIPIEPLRPLAPTTTQMEGKTKQELGDDRAKVYETLGPWLKRHQPKIEYPKIQTIVKKLRANKDHNYVGAVGLCWGG